MGRGAFEGPLSQTQSRDLDREIFQNLLAHTLSLDERWPRAGRRLDRRTSTLEGPCPERIKD